MKRVHLAHCASLLLAITASTLIGQSAPGAPFSDPLEDQEASSPSDRVLAEPTYVSTLDGNEEVHAHSSTCPEHVTCCANADLPRGSTKNLKDAMKNAYQSVFYANSFAYLDSPLFDGPYFPGDTFKGLWEGKMDLGGEFRSRYHNEDNHRGLGLTGDDDQFWLTRLRLFANLRLTESIRLYGEYLYADSAGEDLLIRPIEENRGELQNLFVDVQLSERLSFRGGRQELIFGAERLVSPLDWANTRRTFDGVRATYDGHTWILDAFYTQPVARVRATGGTNEWDNTNREQHFYGLYGSKNLGNANLDAYYFGFDNDTSGFSYHTLGNRLWGQRDRFLFEFEGGIQFGQNADGSDHFAAFATAGLGRKLSVFNDKWKPTIWAWYDWASGGEDLVPGEDGFDHLFPLAHKYNGFMDLFGRRNLHDINVQFITPTPFSNVRLLAWYHYFFLDQATTPFSVLMTPYNTTAAAGSKDLGSEIDLLATITLDPRTSVLLGYSHFVAGDYYSTTLGAVDVEDADFLYAQFQMRF